MNSPELNAWTEQARAMPIEGEIRRRNIKLKGNVERIGPCPKCGGDDRFSINTAKQVFNCRVCKAGGDVIDLVKFLDGVDFMTACRWLAGEPPAKPNGNGKDQAAPEPREVRTASFKYHDEGGATLSAIARLQYQNPDGSFVLKDGKPKKKFSQYRPDPDRPGKWINNINGVRIVPYRLPELIEAIGNEHFVVIVEGEAKVDFLHSWNVPATCNACGAGKWKSEHSEFLRDADAVILPDNDEPGRDHADVVGASLQGIAKSVRVLELPGLPAKGDIIDWAAAGGTREQFDELIVHQARPWAPRADSEHKEEKLTRTNGPIIKSSKDFVADFVPPDYLVDGLLQEAFLYCLTGSTGAGKTTITLRLAASVALGVVFANRETKKRRVLYLAAENPVDARMRWIALAQQMDFDADTIEVYFVEGVFRISQMTDTLKKEAERHGGDFGLVIIDTGPVFYEGDEENNRTQQGRHAEMLRSLIDIIPGKPAVLANCHPVKNAAPDNLLPAGGGNFLNQVDANMTAAKTDNTTELHWQGKFRGADFAPMHFMLRTVTHQRLKDSRNRLIPTVVCDWISDNAKEEIAQQNVSEENLVLAIIDAEPGISLASIALKMEWKLFSGEPNKPRAQRCVKALKGAKLIKETRAGKHKLTDEGKKILKGEDK